MEHGYTPEQIAAEMTLRWGFRPRAAWRHTYGWTQDEVADRFNQIVDSDQAPMTGKRISDYEAWPNSGIKPTPVTLHTLARVYNTTVAKLVDLYDRENYSTRERLALDPQSVPLASKVNDDHIDTNRDGHRVRADSRIGQSDVRRTQLLTRNLPWEKLSETEFEDLIYRLLAAIGFSDRESYRAPSGRGFIVKKVSQELPGLTRIENWTVKCESGSEDLDAVRVRAIISWANESPAFDVLLIVTKNNLTIAAREFLKTLERQKSIPYRVQWIEHDHLEEVARVDEQLISEYFGDLVTTDHPASPESRALFLADLLQAWRAHGEDAARLRAMQRAYQEFQVRYESKAQSDYYASIYLLQSHRIEYFTGGLARRTYRQHLANIGNGPIDRDNVFFYGEAIVSDNEDLHLQTRSVDALLPPPGVEIGLDTYNLKFVSLVLPRPIAPLESYEYEISVDWPYPGPLAKSRYYGVQIDRFTSLLKFAVSFPVGFTAVAPTVFESKDSFDKRIGEPVPLIENERVFMHGDIPLPVPGANYRVAFALQEDKE